VNVRAHFVNRNRFVGARGFDKVETGAADHFRRVHSQQEFILDDKTWRRQMASPITLAGASRL
jgi:hypothetical protein